MIVEPSTSIEPSNSTDFSIITDPSIITEPSIKAEVPYPSIATEPFMRLLLPFTCPESSYYSKIEPGSISSLFNRGTLSPKARNYFS